MWGGGGAGPPIEEPNFYWMLSRDLSSSFPVFGGVVRRAGCLSSTHMRNNIDEGEESGDWVDDVLSF